MLTVLSPAKKLDETSPIRVAATAPPMLDHTRALMQVTRDLTPADLQELMHISDALAELNHARFQAFETPFTDDNARPAALTFAGDVYQGLDAWSLPEAALEWAQGHVAILSGLYGVLRPLDRMQPYRLEMGTRLENPRGADLYAFWRDTIGPWLAESLSSHDDPTLLNLASNEYFKAVDRKVLPGPVVTPVFKDRKDGRSRTISFFAKRARGAMARFVIENRIDTAEGVKAFECMGYRYQPGPSTKARWVFEREQPPPAR